MRNAKKYRVEEVVPEKQNQEGKKAQVARMFDSIAEHYDFLNHLLSLGIDYYWRRQAIRAVLQHNAQPEKVLDVATGTGDLAIALRRAGAGEVIGVDIARQMLAIGHKKVARHRMDASVRLEYGDAEALPFEEHTFDAVTVAFGVRNFAHLSSGLAEIHRVLKPGGLVMILEFSQPTAFPMKQLYGVYSKHVLPLIGRSFSRSKSAYQYLPESVAAFPYGQAFLEILEESGFAQTQAKALTFGISSIYTGIKTP
jgi:demethylmenaquinone methyltransferase/2-methoxy-6-polyprenyl-1,4-benzoquinol methylase